MPKTVKLTQGRVAVVDDEDFEFVANHVWYSAKRRTRRENWYALGRLSGKATYMHRLIMGAKAGDEVDHINGDGLDNRRANLRFVTRSQNNINRLDVPNVTGHRGVYYHPGKRKYQARVWINRKAIGSRYFDTASEAAAARAVLASKHYDIAARA